MISGKIRVARQKDPSSEQVENGLSLQYRISGKIRVASKSKTEGHGTNRDVQKGNEKRLLQYI